LRAWEPGRPEWRRLLSSSWGPAGLYPASRRVVLEAGGGYILVGLRDSIARTGWSLGRDAAGGAACIGGACREPVAAAAAIIALSGSYTALCVTLQDYNPYTARVREVLLGAGWWRMTVLYPRILDLTPYREDPGLYPSRLPKKSRNRWRSFLRRGGVVEEEWRPSRIASEIYRVLNSSRVRQGRPVPGKWRNPRWVAGLVSWMETGVREGWLRIYVAWMDRLAGFTCIQLTRLQGLVTWFLIDPRYARHGVGNALLTEAVMRLASSTRTPILQYGYWRPVNPGLNRFLERQLFSVGRETVICSPGPASPLLRLSTPLARFAEKTSSRLLAAAQHYLREALEAVRG